MRNVVKFGQWATQSQSWLSPKRFLFRNVGDVYLLRTGAAASDHLPLPEDSIEAALQLPLDDFVSKPALLLQTILDHNCTSYVHDILTAARVQQRREMRGRQLPAAPGGASAALPASDVPMLR